MRLERHLQDYNAASPCLRLTPARYQTEREMPNRYSGGVGRRSVPFTRKRQGLETCPARPTIAGTTWAL